MATMPDLCARQNKKGEKDASPFCIEANFFHSNIAQAHAGTEGSSESSELQTSEFGLDPSLTKLAGSYVVNYQVLSRTSLWRPIEG